MKKLSLLIFSLSFLGCASPYKKTLLTGAASGAMGALYGSTRPEYQNQNATMYGAVGALAGVTAGLVLDLDNNNPVKAKAENERLKAKLDEFQKKLEPQVISSGKSLFSSPLPREVSSLIEPGEWKRYKMDQWVQDPNQPNTWYRQVEMFEIIPPSSK